MVQQVPPPPPGFQIIGGGSAPVPSRPSAPRRQPRAAMPQIRFPDDRDAMIRTVIGEAANQPPEGQVAVAGTILGRAAARGLSPSQVVLQQHQFEPWGTAESATRLMAIQPNDPRYITASSAVERALAGEGPRFDHFYSPKAQAALGRPEPSWARGRTPTVIGDHNFYDIGGVGDGEDVQFTAGPSAAAGELPPLPEGFEIVAEAPEVGAPPEVDISGGVQNIDGRAILTHPDGRVEDMGSWGDYWTGQRRSQEEAEKRVEREADPEYQRLYAESRSRAGNIPDQLLSTTGGATGGSAGLMDEILSGVDYLASGFNPMAGQAARDAVRDEQNEYANEKPLENLAFQVGGGFLTPGMAAGGNYIAAASGAQRLGRAGIVGAAYGAESGFANAEGNLLERAPGTAQGTVIGAGAGVIGQGAFDRAGRAIAARAAGEPARSAARRLSRQGVNLTPGQMASEIPIVGSSVKYAEDLLGGFNPLMAGVRRSQNEDVIRAAGNEALAPVGGALPRKTRTGYEVSQEVMRVLGQGYDDVVTRVDAPIDQPLVDGFADLVTRAGTVLDDSHLGRLERILNDGVINRFTAGGRLEGRDFKRIETTLRQQSERANRPNSTLEDQDLSEFLDESRQLVRDLIARHHPEEAETISALNRGYAVAKRIQRAVSGSPQMAREGTPLPGELTQTVQQMSSDGQISNQTGLLQGLASDARTVLPAGMADTGSGQRAVIGGALGVAGTTGIAAVSPALAAGIASGAIVYSKPGIAALNFVYRATDSRELAEGVRQLQRAAARNPALLPYYEAAVQHARALASPDREAAPQGQPSTPVPTLVQ